METRKTKECAAGVFCRCGLMIKLLSGGIIWAAWILAADGCSWTENIVVYLAAIVFFSIAFRENPAAAVATKKSIIAGVEAIAAVVVFYLGIKKFGISGHIIISHIPPKMGIVFTGYFLLFLIFGRYWRKSSPRERLGMAGSALLFAAALQIQKTVSIMSTAGWILGAAVPVGWRLARVPLFWKVESRERYVRPALSIIFALFCVLGEWEIWQRYEKAGGVVWMILLLMLISGLGWFILFELALSCLYRGSGILKVYDRYAKKPGWKQGAWMMGGMLLCWVPYFLACYPGRLSTDSISQLSQALEVTGYSNHHPWLHTLLIKLCVTAGKAIGGDLNSGVACYTIVSMVFMAGCCSLTLFRMGKRGTALWVRALLWCFFALFPINAAYMTTMWKDVIFAGAVLLFLNILDVILEKKRKEENLHIAHWLLLGAGSICLCLLRSNGFYAWIFMLPFLVWKFRKSKRSMQGVFLTVCGVLAFYFIYKSVVLPAFRVSEPDLIESLSIPAQQIACVLANEGEITQEEKALLEKVINTDQVKERYLFYISDPIKYLIRSRGNQSWLQENWKEYLRLYIDLGMRYPSLYMRAFVDQTKGYWYYKVDNWIVYTEGMKENTLGVYRDPLLPGKAARALEHNLVLFEDLYHKFSGIALTTWFLFVGAGYALIKRQSVIPYVFPAGIVLTLLIATPVSAEFRYMYAVFLAVPVLVAGTICDAQKYRERDSVDLE